MEIGLREWLVIGGVILIGLIILDGWRRMNGNRNRLRMDIDPAAAELPEEPVRSSNPELPNGGARLVGEDPLFAEMNYEQTQHAVDPLVAVHTADADILFDHHEPLQERIEPELGNELEPSPIDQISNHSQSDDQNHRVADDYRPTERLASATARDPFIDDDCGEIVSPMRVVTGESSASAERQPVGPAAAKEQHDATLDSRFSHRPFVEQITERRVSERHADSTRAQSADAPIEPLFPTLDGFEESSGERQDQLSPARAYSKPSPEAESDRGVSVSPTEVGQGDEEFEPFISPAVMLKDAPCDDTEPASEQGAYLSAATDDHTEVDLDKPIPLFLDDDEKAGHQEVQPSFFVEETDASGHEFNDELKKTPVNQTPVSSSNIQNSADKVPEPVPETEDLFIERPVLEKAPDPESVLAITVLAGESLPIPGATLLPLVNACGMRFGDMNIFHRFEDGIEAGAVQFSMASAINPGTFDLNSMDQMTTCGLTFFMSMEEPRDVMNAFECMLATAETVAKHMGAELLDENRSVLRPQTKEHYRQRIRDFGMRNLSRRVH